MKIAEQHLISQNKVFSKIQNNKKSNQIEVKQNKITHHNYQTKFIFFALVNKFVV